MILSVGVGNLVVIHITTKTERATKLKAIEKLKSTSRVIFAHLYSFNR